MRYGFNLPFWKKRRPRRSGDNFPAFGLLTIHNIVSYAMVGSGRIYMMTAYPKNQQDDLTSEDRKAILRVIEQLLGGDQ